MVRFEEWVRLTRASTTGVMQSNQKLIKVNFWFTVIILVLGFLFEVTSSIYLHLGLAEPFDCDTPWTLFIAILWFSLIVFVFAHQIHMLNYSVDDTLKDFTNAKK